MLVVVTSKLCKIRVTTLSEEIVKVKMRSHQIHTSAQIEFAGADTEGSGDFVFQKQATIVSLHLNACQIFSTHRPDLDDHLFWVCRVVWPRGATPISRSERNMLTCHVR